MFICEGESGCCVPDIWTLWLVSWIYVHRYVFGCSRRCVQMSHLCGDVPDSLHKEAFSVQLRSQPKTTPPPQKSIANTYLKWLCVSESLFVIMFNCLCTQMFLFLRWGVSRNRMFGGRLRGVAWSKQNNLKTTKRAHTFIPATIKHLFTTIETPTTTRSARKFAETFSSGRYLDSPQKWLAHLIGSLNPHSTHTKLVFTGAAS